MLLRNREDENAAICQDEIGRRLKMNFSEVQKLPKMRFRVKEILPIVDEYDKIIDEADKANFDKTTGRIYRTVSLVLFDKSGNF